MLMNCFVLISLIAIMLLLLDELFTQVIDSKLDQLTSTVIHQSIVFIPVTVFTSFVDMKTKRFTSKKVIKHYKGLDGYTYYL